MLIIDTPSLAPWPKKEQTGPRNDNNKYILSTQNKLLFRMPLEYVGHQANQQVTLVVPFLVDAKLRGPECRRHTGGNVDGLIHMPCANNSKKGACNQHEN